MVACQRACEFQDFIINIQDLGPSYLIDLLKSMTTESVYDLNPKYELESSGRGAFSVSAPIMWNSLLDHIRQANSKDNFKSLLKPRLFKQASYAWILYIKFIYIF